MCVQREKGKDIYFSQAVKNSDTENSSSLSFYPSLCGKDSTKFDSIEDRIFHLIH